MNRLHNSMSIAKFSPFLNSLISSARGNLATALYSTLLEESCHPLGSPCTWVELMYSHLLVSSPVSLHSKPSLPQFLGNAHN